VDILLEILATAAIAYAVYRVPEVVRARARRRRGAATAGVTIPVRLRGLDPAYPGYWQAGRLDPATAGWRPRGPWGAPVSLAGARVDAVGPATKKDAMPPFAADDILLSCTDRYGQVCQLAVYDADEARLAMHSLSTATAVHDAVRPGSGARLRWPRHRTPLAAVVLLFVAVLGPAYLLVPLLGAREVDAVVTRNRGGSYLCDVAWTDAVGRSGGHGQVSCGDRLPGEHLRVHAMGWPRTGTAEDPSTAVILGVISGSVPLMLTVLMVIGPITQRHALARTAAALDTTDRRAS
jgi:hypothetical protein